jgi:hypothetical protein
MEDLGSRLSARTEVRSGYDLAALRLHVSLPPLFLQGLNDWPWPGDGGLTLRYPLVNIQKAIENGDL